MEQARSPAGHWVSLLFEIRDPARKMLNAKALRQEQWDPGRMEGAGGRGRGTGGLFGACGPGQGTVGFMVITVALCDRVRFGF